MQHPQERQAQDLGLLHFGVLRHGGAESGRMERSAGYPPAAARRRDSKAPAACSSAFQDARSSRGRKCRQGRNPPGLGALQQSPELRPAS